MLASALTFATIGAFFALWGVASVPADDEVTGLHLAANGNFRFDGAYLPGRIGFNLADVGSRGNLDKLPPGVKGLVWLGLCGGVDAKFLKTVLPYIGNPKVFGFYLMDDPDPTGRYSHHCAGDNLKAESDWLHANAPGAKTFVFLMNLASSPKAPSFGDSYGPAKSGIDLFGFAAYPCRTEFRGCDLDMIDRYLAAAEASGVPRSRIVPVYQAFGSGDWADESGGRFVLPTVAQEQNILSRWAQLVPSAAFDYAYSWGSQRGDVTLAGSSELQSVFSRHNRAD